MTRHGLPDAAEMSDRVALGTGLEYRRAVQAEDSGVRAVDRARAFRRATVPLLLDRACRDLLGWRGPFLGRCSVRAPVTAAQRAQDFGEELGATLAAIPGDGLGLVVRHATPPGAHEAHELLPARSGVRRTPLGWTRHLDCGSGADGAVVTIAGAGPWRTGGSG